MPSLFKFAQHGNSRAWISELMPHTVTVADQLCFIKSMFTEAINHDSAVTFFQTGFQLAGRPSIGAWLAYGLGSENSPDAQCCDTDIIGVIWASAVVGPSGRRATGCATSLTQSRKSGTGIGKRCETVS